MEQNVLALLQTDTTHIARIGKLTGSQLIVFNLNSRIEIWLLKSCSHERTLCDGKKSIKF